MDKPERTAALIFINDRLNGAYDECTKFADPKFRDLATKIDKIRDEVAEMVLQETGAEIKSLKELKED